jgi:hypothetical protein
MLSAEPDDDPEEETNVYDEQAWQWHQLLAHYQ